MKVIVFSCFLGLLPERSLVKAASITALSSNSLDSASTSSNKYTQYTTLTFSTGTAQNESKSEKACLPLQEPDVIASTKTSNSKSSSTKQNIVSASSPLHNPSIVDAPIAPPRRKKKNKICSTNLALTVRYVTFI